MKFIGKELLWDKELEKLAIEVPIVVESQACYIRTEYFAEQEKKAERFEIRLDSYISSIEWKIVKREIENGYHKLLTIEEVRNIAQRCCESNVIILDDMYHIERVFKEVDVRINQFEEGTCDEIPIKVQVVDGD